MGVHPKIGITGLPRSGKSAVMLKVMQMLQDERERELRSRGENPSEHKIIGGMLTAPSMKLCRPMWEGLAVDALPARDVPAIRQAMRVAGHVRTDCASVRVLCLVQPCDVPLLLGQARATSGETTRIARL